MTIINWEDTLASLQIDSLGDDYFTAPNIPMRYSRIFGGQLLAQCVRIGAICGDGKSIRSLQMNFLREGDLNEPLRFELRRIREGRTFATHLILADQGGQLILMATLSLHIDEAGPEHQLEAPRLGSPEDQAPAELSMIPWETRPVGGVNLESREIGPARYAFWMRAPELPDEPSIHQALLAHATDLTLIGTALRPFSGLSEADSGERIQTAVSAHSLVYHRPLRVDRWLLVSQESPISAGGRGFGIGHVYSRSGELLASFAQESLIRLLDT